MRARVVDVLGIRPPPEVARAQLEALRQRVPVLYGILTASVIACAWTHNPSNPAWQTIGLPLAFALVTTLRTVAWIRMQPSCMTDQEIAAIRHRTLIVGVVIGLLILVWALTLQGSSEYLEKIGIMTDTGHTVFFVGITVICCIFLLMHHRLAAIAVGISILFPFTLYLFSSQRLIEKAIGLNMLLVGIAMLYVAVSFSRHFDQSVVSAADLLRLSAQNARLAASDVVTSLPNRRQFFRELEAAGAANERFAVIVCDLDGFKQVNDVYGHHAGDEVLCHIAARLVAAAPPGCCVARMGGDEFTCLLVGEQARAAQAVAERMIAACCEPIVSGSFTAQVGASAGFCQSDRVQALNFSLIYERADYALFEAKRAGRGRVVAFSGTHDLSMRRQSLIAHLLRCANLDREMRPLFQPIVDAHTMDIRAFEALVRWTSPELGPVGPHEFIPIAERTDLIFQISRLVLQAALLEAAAWPDQIGLKVNLSVRDLMSTQQTRVLMAELDRSCVAPARVTFEITETILAESIEQIRANVDLLRSSGCKIAIDDFGVGFSSMNYIHALAPDIIKIDRCFIAEIATNDVTRRVVRTIVELARNVGAKTVAEGVESAAQARILAELGCDELQGFYFSEPVSAAASIDIARRNTTAAAPRTTEHLASA